MNNVDVFSPFLAVIYTQEEAEKVQNIIEESLNNLYKLDHTSVLTTMLQNLPAQVSESIQQIMQQHIISQENPDAVKDFCDNLIKSLKQTVLLNLTVVNDLSFEVKQKVCNLIKSEFGTNALTAINIDPTLIGGAIITFKGEYLDYSLKSKIKHFWDSNQP